jgi:general secretion pathway protein G
MISLEAIGGYFIGSSKRTAASHRGGRLESQAGFTLVEMLVVIAIIGLIMGLIGPRVLNYLSESKVKAARIQLQSFASALDLKGGNVPNDPWNHTYVYRSPGEHGPYDIVSYGSDGQEGGSGVAADISLESLHAKNE